MPPVIRGAFIVAEFRPLAFSQVRIWLENVLAAKRTHGFLFGEMLNYPNRGFPFWIMCEEEAFMTENLAIVPWNAIGGEFLAIFKGAS
jgi:hypothetical protein